MDWCLRLISIYTYQQMNIQRLKTPLLQGKISKTLAIPWRSVKLVNITILYVQKFVKYSVYFPYKIKFKYFQNRRATSIDIGNSIIIITYNLSSFVYLKFLFIVLPCRQCQFFNKVFTNNKAVLKYAYIR